jgi:hypothetical protein
MTLPCGTTTWLLMLLSLIDGVYIFFTFYFRKRCVRVAVRSYPVVLLPSWRRHCPWHHCRLPLPSLASGNEVIFHSCLVLYCFIDFGFGRYLNKSLDLKLMDRPMVARIRKYFLPIWICGSAILNFQFGSGRPSNNGSLETTLTFLLLLKKICCQIRKFKKIKIMNVFLFESLIK